MSDILSIFRPDFLLHNALWGSIAVGLFCPLIGVYFYLRRLVLLGMALPQISSAGIAFVFFIQGLGVTWSLHPGETNDKALALVGSVFFTIVAIFLLAYLERRRDVSVDSQIGAAYALAFAAALLFVSQNVKGKSELLDMLNGEIVSLNSRDLHLLLYSYVGLVSMLFLFNRQFLLVSFDRDTAVVMGKNTLVWDAILYALMGFSISIGVLIVGPMLTFAFLIIPPLAARRFCRRMRTFFILSALIGGASGFVGFYLSYHLDWPLAPTDIVVASGLLVLSYLIKKTQLIFTPAK